MASKNEIGYRITCKNSKGDALSLLLVAGYIPWKATTFSSPKGGPRDYRARIGGLHLIESDLFSSVCVDSGNALEGRTEVAHGKRKAKALES